MMVTCFHIFKGAESDQIKEILDTETLFSKENPLTADPAKMIRLTYLRKPMAIRQLYPDKIFKRRGDRFIDESGREYIVKAVYEGNDVIVDDNSFVVYKNP